MPKKRLKVGAVLTFPEGVTEKEVREFLLEWQSDLGKDESQFEYDSIQVGSYNPTEGGPVFYVP